MKIAAFLALLLAGWAPQEKSAPPERVGYYDHVQPILSIHCAKCHGAEKPKGSLRLDRRENLLKGGDSGEAAVVPGKSGASALLRRVASHDPDDRMPPKGPPLAAHEIEILRRWIDQGAVWPEKDDYWAFQRPRAEEVGSIDAFVDARLGAAGLRRSPPADRVVLLRRVFADLVGVPPTPEEAGAFLDDASPQAWEKLVDRLLADPRYGERWARHWLDLVRYSESNGFENDKVRPHAWRYRDYVVRSLNDDKPYDRFLMEQVAGDELWPGDADALVATGFARLGPWDDLCKNEKQRWQDYLNDATDTLGSVLLGFTVGCARCHDHKYDRITQEDYYSLQAFFAAGKRETKALPASWRDPEPVRRRLEEELAALAPLLRERRSMRERARGWIAALKRNVLGPDAKGEVSDEELNKLLDLRHPKRREALEKEIRQREAEADFWRPRTEAVFEAGRDAPKTHLLRRGELHSPGPEVLPGFVAAMAEERLARVLPPEGGGSTGRRSALARWLASPGNPMTARVMVNRLWQHHFGQGIVATPSDFGRNGRRPSHPELLDWLSVRLIREGWRLKPLHRLMLLSETYRQASAHDAAAARVDPENRLLWRMNRQRLEGEAIRDGILAVAGRLNPKAGGPGVYAPISKEVLVELPNNDKLLSWGSCPEAEGLRRSVYVFQRRALMYPMMEAFDGADMNHSCPKRAVTTVAPQALALFNGEFSRGEAKHFAARVAREAGDDAGKRVERAYLLALVRPPTAEERARAAAFLEEQALRRLEPAGAGTGAGRRDAAALQEASRAALADFCHVLINTNEFVYLD